MKKKLRILLTWTVISLLVQFALYSFLDHSIAKVLAPPSNEPITASLTARIPGSNLENPQLSYDKKYLATVDHGVFKVFNLKSEKLVFSKSAPSGNPKGMGVISYKWLPDRNTLIYFYARQNPAAPNPTPAKPATQTKATVAHTSAAQLTVPKTQKEDPQESLPSKPQPESPKPSTPAPSQTQPVKPYNPQITELYTLEFLDDEGIEPEDRKNDVESLDSYFPAGGQIIHLDFSTSTNLIYLTVKSGTTMKLLEIDVMKDISNLTKGGETITNVAVSDQYGTLYIDSKQGTSKQVAAVKGWQRYAITKKDNQYLLGTGNGVVYLGEIDNNQLVKILTVKDSSDLKNINTAAETQWEGSIPFKDSKTVIGSKGQLIIYGQNQLHVVQDGKEQQIDLGEEKGETSYVTRDGAELFQLRPEGSMTIVELKPLTSL
ncbi:hypothetical protein [Paradesulfitobacterium ferrireducens]|uniref:hypothetical protein n=1 Tax=Paradesulfitobacterium ferrireducens TaxID=2816476 RepID=UPI001A8C8021|nr:hypothetical protein [Paradesulfitobacterium ferrireducens]